MPGVPPGREQGNSTPSLSLLSHLDQSVCPASLNVIRYEVRNGAGPLRRVPSTQTGYIGAEETLRMSRLASWELHPFGLDPVFVSFARTGKQVKSASAPPCEPSPRSLGATCPYDGVHGLGSRRRTPHRCLAPRASHPIPAIKGHRAHLPFPLASAPRGL